MLSEDDYISVLPLPCIEDPRSALMPASVVSEKIGKLGFAKAVANGWSASVQEKPSWLITCRRVPPGRKK